MFSPAASPYNTITYNGKVYATLADVHPSPSGSFCQNYYLPLPSGWIVAPHSQDALYVTYANSWSTGHVVLANGCLYATGSAGAGGCGGYLSSSGSTYSSGYCNAQILIVQQASPVTSNIYTFNGRQYATLADVSFNSAPAIAGGTISFCQNYYMSLPTYWAAAVDNSDSRYVISATGWSSSYVILSNGNAYYAGTAAGLYGSGRLLTSGATYSASVCNSQVNQSISLSTHIGQRHYDCINLSIY